MAVGLEAPQRLTPVAGIRIGCSALGNRARPRDDLTLIELADGAAVAATFTRNAFRAAPVTVAETHLRAGRVSYLLINAGNANAGTGEKGLDDARACCAAVAELAGCKPEQVLPFSTGVVGEPLDASRFPPAIEKALSELKAEGWLNAASAIATTDTVAKGHSAEFSCGGRQCVVTGIAKGSGMIRPDMATMLSFVATDAKISASLLNDCLRRAVDRSFNRITVDGDTSTNDACVLIATGKSGAPPIDSLDSAEGSAFADALGEVCTRRPFTGGQDGDVCQRSQLGPYPRRGGTRRNRGSGSERRRHRDRRRQGRGGRRPGVGLSRGGRQARHVGRGDRSAHPARPGRRQRDDMDLRSVL